MKVSAGQVLIGVAGAGVIAAVIGGLFFLGPPEQERARRLDQRRVRELGEIALAVNLHWTRSERLPGSLGELSQDSRTPLRTEDPETAQRYEYRLLSAETYELCADFQLDSIEPSSPTESYFWSHGTGRHCYQLEAEEVDR